MGGTQLHLQLPPSTAAPLLMGVAGTRGLLHQSHQVQHYACDQIFCRMASWQHGLHINLTAVPFHALRNLFSRQKELSCPWLP